ncbi:MAG: beta-ketoacyl synthase, partial [Bacteroidetes bacterium]|nr:beta-ketoacyl synthase [Bacteroidota bacterium]
MKIYLRSTGNVSPQKTFGDVPFLTEPASYSGNRLSCVEPDYKEFIDVKLIRRMSRIIKMGVAAGFACLKEANVEIPDAIITGTA